MNQQKLQFDTPKERIKMSLSLPYRYASMSEGVSGELLQPKSREVKENSLEFEKYLSLISTLKGHEEFMLDSNGVIISSNLEAVNITGYEEYEIIGKHVSVFYPADEQQKATDDLRKARSIGNIVVTGMRLKKRSFAFWAKMTIRFTSDAQDFYKVTLQDNTHRKLSKIKLQSFRDEFLTIFNNPFIGTFKFKKSDGHVFMCNQKMLDIIGRENSDKLYFNSFFNSVGQWGQFCSIIEQDKKVEGFQFIINDKRTDQSNWGLVSARWFEKQGFIGGVLMDISEQYHQMTELQRVNNELENFTYHASHDLRAPLTTVMGLVNLGVKETTVQGAQNYFKLILQRIHHLDGLLKDLVSISYNSKGEVKSEPFDFKHEIEVLIAALHVPYHTVKIECSIVQPQVFITDPTRVRTILRNLISNSLKYHNPESASCYLIIKVRVGPTYASLTVQDNGIGIDQTYKDKIFDMFFRATTQASGSGLGLYIVKSMLEKLRGKIAVESTLRHGTTFLITIPNNTEEPSNKPKLIR